MSRGATPYYAARMPERELQQLVTDLCRLLGLPHFHVRHSRGMTPGWPDSVIIGTHVIYRELKAEHGQLSPDQRAIGDRLKAAGADWKVWRPRDWLSGDIERERCHTATAPAAQTTANPVGCRGWSHRGTSGPA